MVLLLGVNDAKVATEGTKQFRTRQFLKGYAQILRAFVDDFPDLRAVYYSRRADIPQTGRGDAAAGTWTFCGWDKTRSVETGARASGTSSSLIPS